MAVGASSTGLQNGEGKGGGGGGGRRMIDRKQRGHTCNTTKERQLSAAADVSCLGRSISFKRGYCRSYPAIAI